MTTNMLASLNPQQRASVTLPPGPVLVQAGAGTGKTRVLTIRIAYLIHHYGVSPNHILALTFTNKAAKELRERLRSQLGNRIRGLKSGTFHSICSRILRAEIAGRIGNYTGSFTIYAADEQLQLAAEILDSASEKPPSTMEPENLLWHISRAKSRLVKPRLKMRATAASQQVAIDPFVMGCYRRYQRALEKANALDFDDLIMLTHQLFTEHPDVLDRYQEQWQHILVDEYQDTDPSQHGLLEILSRPHGNDQARSLFVVGDGMQSIYGFRNADHTIIANFTRDFPEAQVCNLTTNYRSRQPILHAAYAVIRHSRTVRPMQLESVSSSLPGEQCIHIIDAKDGRDEAERIARIISNLEQDGRRSGEMAVLYRTRHMSRTIETALRQAHIPYRVRGATGFYDRAVIRDALAYLRVIANPSDSLSITRIANRPARGLGAQSLSTLNGFAVEHDIPLSAALAHPKARAALSTKAATGAQTLASLLARWQQLIKGGYPPDHLLSDVLERSGYVAWLEQRLEAEELSDAQAHLQELIAAAQEHTDLSNFLQEVALMTNTDNEEEDNRRVELLTIHAAKGLEWNIVFVTGLEEGTLPHERNLANPSGIEEERRLCYVALTRAGEKLYLSWAQSRYRGKPSKPSRFLGEIEAYGKERAGAKKM